MTSKDATVEPIAVNPAKSDCVKSTPKIVVTDSGSISAANTVIGSKNAPTIIITLTKSSFFMFPPLIFSTP
jgi:hypothetical protein